MGKEYSYVVPSAVPPGRLGDRKSSGRGEMKLMTIDPLEFVLISGALAIVFELASAIVRLVG